MPKIPKGGRAVGATELLVSGQIPHPRTHTADHQGTDTFRCCFMVGTVATREAETPDKVLLDVDKCGHTEHTVAAIERHVRTHGGARYETVT